MKNKKSQSHIRAPSDEGGFGFRFRSPLQAFKDNFWPQKGNMKHVPLDEPKKYDDKIIQKALDDLAIPLPDLLKYE